MSKIKETGIIIGLFMTSISCLAQKNDSIKAKQDSLNFPKRAVAFVADNFAISRPLNIEYSNTAPYNFDSKKGTGIFPDGKVTSFQQMKASANITLIKKQSWILGTTLGYKYTSAETAFNQPGNTTLNIDNDFHYLISSLNLTNFSSMVGKRMVYTSSFLVDGSEKHFERLKGLVTATMVLKANQKTKMTAGLLVNIDPSSQSLILPTITYEHKFDNGLIADFILPRSLYIRKFVFNTNGRISAGTQLDQTSFYLYNLDGTNQKYEYRQLDINSGLSYEHVLAKYFIITVKAGLKLRLLEGYLKKRTLLLIRFIKLAPIPHFISI